MENEYIRERPLQEIVDKLMTPQEEEEEEKKDEEGEGEEAKAEAEEPVVDKKGSQLSNKKEPVRSSA